MKIVPACVLGLLAALRLYAESVDLGAGQRLELIRIEPGTFLQGSPPDEPGRGADETARMVRLTRPFQLGKFPVTRGQFARFVAESGYRTEAESGPSGGFGWDGTQLVQRKEFTWRNAGFPQTDEHPVVLVTYRDAEAFLRWLTTKSGRAFALPSEAQWEYAARAGATVPPAQADAWHRENAGNGTHGVNEKAQNAWDLGDLLGNTWEWCEDWYAPYPDGDATDPLQRNPNLSDKPRRVLRGGSWLREPKFCRPAARYRNDPASRNADNGFRVMTFAVEASAPAAVEPLLEKPLEAPAVAEHSAHGSEPHPSPPPSTGSSGFGWLLAIPVLGLGLALLVALIKRFARPLTAVSGGRGKSLHMPGQPLRVRVADDGFWILSDEIARGTLLACRYHEAGGPRTTEVTFQPGPNGHFVFTGSHPDNVSVTISAPAVGRDDMIDLPPPLPAADHSPEPFQGHPPAY